MTLYDINTNKIDCVISDEPKISESRYKWQSITVKIDGFDTAFHHRNTGNIFFDLNNKWYKTSFTDIASFPDKLYTTNLIGQTVKIDNKRNIYHTDSGKVIHFDGLEYHIAPSLDEKDVQKLTFNDFTYDGKFDQAKYNNEYRKKKLKNLSFTLPKAEADAFGEKLASEGRTMAGFFKQAIDEYMKE